MWLGMDGQSITVTMLYLVTVLAYNCLQLVAIAINTSLSLAK